MLVGSCKVCPDVHKLHDDPGVGLPDDVVPEPAVAARLNLRLFHNDVSKPERERLSNRYI